MRINNTCLTCKRRQPGNETWKNKHYFGCSGKADKTKMCNHWSDITFEEMSKEDKNENYKI